MPLSGGRKKMKAGNGETTNSHNAQNGGKSKKKKMSAGKKGKRKLLNAPEVDPLMDLSVPVWPLGFYVNDRCQLMDQVFISLARDNCLDALIPEMLRDLPINELQSLCVQQLEIMSKKRIKKILAGEEMESSSGTEDSEEEEQAVLKNKKEAVNTTEAMSSEDYKNNNNDGNKEKVVLAENCDMLEIHAENSDDDMLSEVETKAEVMIEPEENDSRESQEAEEGELELPGFDIDSMQLSKPSVTIAKTCMEILELELRARAIKALLKSQTPGDKLTKDDQD